MNLKGNVHFNVLLFYTNSVYITKGLFVFLKITFKKKIIIIHDLK